MRVGSATRPPCPRGSGPRTLMGGGLTTSIKPMSDTRFRREMWWSSGPPVGAQSQAARRPHRGVGGAGASQRNINASPASQEDKSLGACRVPLLHPPPCFETRTLSETEKLPRTLAGPPYIAFPGSLG